MRKEFTMTDDEYKAIMDASKPTPVMFLSGGKPMFNSPQENANYAWKKLAENRGFVWDSARPGSNGDHTFTAIIQG